MQTQNKRTMKKCLFLIVFIFIGTLSCLFGQSKIKAIKAGRLIDVVNGIVLTNQIILVDSTKIIEIGSAVTIPEDAEIIDLSNATVLPGLMDCHTHLAGSREIIITKIYSERPQLIMPYLRLSMQRKLWKLVSQWYVMSAPHSLLMFLSATQLMQEKLQ